MRFVDRQGKDVPNGTRCLAVHDNGDGTTTIYYKSVTEVLVDSRVHPRPRSDARKCDP